MGCTTTFSLPGCVFFLVACSAPANQTGRVAGTSPDAASREPNGQPAASVPSVPAAVRLHERGPVSLLATTERLPAMPAGRPLATGPSVTADAYLSTSTATAGPLVAGDAKNLERLLAAMAVGDPGRPDMLFRLGQHYAQAHAYWRLRGIELDADIAGAPEAGRAKLRSLQAQMLAEARRAVVQSTQHFKRLLADPGARTYARMDSAIFQLAYRLQSVGLLRESRKLFARLIKEHPTSKHIPEAYLAFGDYFFDQKGYANAEKFYRKVLHFPRSSIYHYTSYKLGWVYLGLAKHQDALFAFMKAVPKTLKGASQQALQDATLESFLIAYAAVGLPHKVYPMLKRLARSRAIGMLERLSEIYGARGERAKQVVMWRQMAMFPLPGDDGSVRACVLHSQILAAEAEAGQIEGARAGALANVVRARRELPSLAAGAPCAVMSRVALAKATRAWHSQLYLHFDERRAATVLMLHEAYLEVAVHASEAMRSEAAFLAADVQWLRAAAQQDPSRAVDLWQDAAARFNAVSMRDSARKVEATQAATQARANADALIASLAALN